MHNNALFSTQSEDVVLFLDWGAKCSGEDVDHNDENHRNPNCKVVLVTLGVVSIPEGHPLSDEEAGGQDLQKDGAAQQTDHHIHERWTQLQGMSQLVGICGQQGNIHQALYIGLVVGYLLQMAVVPF